MNTAEKLQCLRNREGYSQEELGEKLGISRQAISKWESGQTIPDLKKLILLSELYNVSVDSLVRDDIELTSLEERLVYEKEEVSNVNKNFLFTKVSLAYEYKSERSLFGIPLVHINIGLGMKRAKGIISIGNISSGLISIGFLSCGLLSLGFLSLGIISIAILSVALLLSIGVFSIGFIAVGAISLGVFSFGAIAFGKYAIGALAIASDIALGDNAHANIAIGNTVSGINTLPMSTSIEEATNVIRREYPNISQWIINIFKFFI